MPEQSVKSERLAGSLKERAYQILRRMILTGELSGGTQIIEAELAQKLKASRTPIRECVLRLEQEGLLRVVPHKGIFVSEISLKEIKDILQLRYCLELFAIREAVSLITEVSLNEMTNLIALQEAAIKEGDIYEFMELDRQFHLKVYEVIGNDKMLRIMSNLRDQLVACGIRGLRKRERLIQVIDEHREVVRALRARDGDAAFAAVMTHLERVKASLVEL